MTTHRTRPDHEENRMPDYVRVTDDVKPPRHYTIPATAYNPEVHELLEDEPATERDGTLRPPVYEPEENPSDDDNGDPGDGYDDLTVEDLKALLEQRQLTTSGRKQELVDRLRAADDTSVAGDDPANPEGDS